MKKVKVKETDLDIAPFKGDHAYLGNGQSMLLDGNGEVFTLVCCDCGLTHWVEVGPTNKDHIVFTLGREEKKTAAYRRGNRPQLKEGVGKWKLTRMT